MNYAIIMAGGSGTRLWPLSRKKRPKQFLGLFEGQTLLRKCFQRLAPIFEVSNIIVVTNASYADLVRQNLPELPASNVIAEPEVRDTAAAIGLAATVLAKTDADATMVVVTADHMIEPAETLQQALKDGLTFVNSNPENLIVFGVEPTFPDTRLGYVNFAEGREFAGCKNKVHTVKAFKEKPDLETAKKYIESGQYYWNSGMFVWKAGAILSKLEHYLP